MSDKSLELPNFGEFSKWLINDENRDRSLSDLANITDNPLWWLYVVPNRPNDRDILQAVIGVADHESMTEVAGPFYTDAIIRMKLTTVYDISKEDYRQMAINLVNFMLVVVTEDDRRVARRLEWGDPTGEPARQSRRLAEVAIAGLDHDHQYENGALYGYVSTRLLNVLRKLKSHPSKGL